MGRTNGKPTSSIYNTYERRDRDMAKGTDDCSTLEVQRVHLQPKVYSYPIICQRARDYHAIPATSDSSERVFSMASKWISKKTTRMRNRMN